MEAKGLVLRPGLPRSTAVVQLGTVARTPLPPPPSKTQCPHPHSQPTGVCEVACMRPARPQQAQLEWALVMKGQSP